MSRKHRIHRGRLPAVATRPADRESTVYKPDGTLVASRTIGQWTKAETVTGQTAAAIAAAVGIVRGGSIEHRATERATPYTGYDEVYTTTVPEVQPLGVVVLDMGNGRIVYSGREEHIPASNIPARITPDSASPDAMLTAGHWTYTVELLPSQAAEPVTRSIRERHQHRRYIRGSAVARQELTDIVEHYGLHCTEQGRKQHLNGTYYGGSTRYVIRAAGCSEEALGMLCRMEYVRCIHRQWVAETGSSNVYAPVPMELRKQRMQQRNARYRDLRQQFGVRERGFWRKGDGDRAGHAEYIASRS